MVVEVVVEASDSVVTSGLTTDCSCRVPGKSSPSDLVTVPFRTPAIEFPSFSII